MDKASALLRRMMLAVLLALLVLAMGMTVLRGLESKSYLIALILGFAAAGILLLIKKGCPLWTGFENVCHKLGKIKCAVILSGLCFLLGLAWIVLVPIEPWSDYKTYWDCAVSLAKGTEIYSTEYVAMYPHILGYASFLAPFIRIFGEQVFVGTFLGLLLSCLTGLAIYGICLDVFGLISAVLAFLLWSFYPCRIMLGSLIFSEPLYTFLLALFFWLVLRLAKAEDKMKSKWVYAAAWGLGLGLLLRCINSVRPIGAILIIALLIWLLLLRGRKLLDKALLGFWLITLLAGFAGYQLSGNLWQQRLENILGEETAGLPIYNLYVGFNMDTLGQWSAEDMDLLFEYRRQEGGSAPEAQKAMLPHVLERIKSGEVDYVKLFSSKLFAFMGNDELGGYTYRYTRSEGFVRLCMVICNCYYYLVMALAILGTLGLFRREPGEGFSLLPLYTIGLSLAHLLIEVSSRYHYSLIPMFIIFAALSWADKRKGDAL